VLLIAPFKHPVVDAAEEFLFAYIKAELGTTQQQLAEHRGYGLPDLQAIKAQLGRMGLACHSYPSGYIHSWLAMMVAKHYLFGLTDDPQIHMRVDRYYIQWLAADERREPSYRHYVVTAKDNCGDWLAAVERTIRRTIRTEGTSDGGSWEQTVNWLIDLLALKRTGETRQEKEQAANVQQTISMQQQIDHLLHMLAQRDGQLADLQRRSLWQSEVIEDLRLQVGRLANGRIMRLLNWLTHKH
jgi:hypothetical protein